MLTADIIQRLSEGKVVHSHVVQMLGEPIRVLIVPSTAWDGDSPEIAIAVEGQGMIMIDPTRPLTAFRFVAMGFDMEISQALLELLQPILQPQPETKNLDNYA